MAVWWPWFQKPQPEEDPKIDKYFRELKKEREKKER